MYPEKTTHTIPTV